LLLVFVRLEEALAGIGNGTGAILTGLKAGFDE
jgi:hypothetical protein